MVLPVSPNSISLAQIQTEFGGSDPIGINEYYAGGLYVPAGGGGTTITTFSTSSFSSMMNSILDFLFLSLISSISSTLVFDLHLLILSLAHSANNSIFVRLDKSISL